MPTGDIPARSVDGDVTCASVIRAARCIPRACKCRPCASVRDAGTFVGWFTANGLSSRSSRRVLDFSSSIVSTCLASRLASRRTQSRRSRSSTLSDSVHRARPEDPGENEVFVGGGVGDLCEYFCEIFFPPTSRGGVRVRPNGLGRAASLGLRGGCHAAPVDWPPFPFCFARAAAMRSTALRSAAAATAAALLTKQDVSQIARTEIKKNSPLSLGRRHLWVGKSSQRSRRVGRAFGGSRRDAAASAPRGPALVRRVVMTPGG